MKKMNIARLNLNSLVALDVLLAECHVSRAAEKLHITQSALSVTLSQLREFFADELLVRGPNTMIPTPKALQLQPKIRAILDQINKDILCATPFDPKTMQKTFTIGMNDYTQLVLLPRIIHHIHKEAPGINLVVRYIADLNDTNYFESNEIDIGIGPLSLDSPMLATQTLFTDTAICVVDRANTTIKSKLTLKKYLAAKHISVWYEQDVYLDIIDKILKDLGHKRHILLAVQNMFTAIQLIKGTEFIATIAKKAGDLYSKQYGLKLIDLPFETPAVTLKMIWHRKYNNDDAHTWLRKAINAIIQ